MSEIIRKTASVCPNCLKRISAEIVLKDDSNIYMQKRCKDCGEFEALLWEDGKKSYLNWAAPLKTRKFTEPDLPLDIDKGCPYDCGLCAAHKNSGCCVLLELTKRCNLHCPICFASAAEGECEPDPSLEDIESWFLKLSSYGRPFNIQLSGGEPSLRDDLPEIMALGRRYGFSFSAQHKRYKACRRARICRNPQKSGARLCFFAIRFRHGISLYSSSRQSAF